MKYGAVRSSRLVFFLFAVSLVFSAIAHGAAPSPVADVRIIPDVASPQPVTSSVTFTATAKPGETGAAEFAFYLQAPGSSAWIKMRDFRSNDSWSWSTAGLRTGTYGIAVDARSPGSATTVRKIATFTLTPLPAPSAVSINACLATGKSSLANVTFAAAATGGTGNYEYAFHIQKAGNKEWNKTKGYSDSSAWAPPGDLSPGTYCVCVYARTRGTAPAKGFDAYKTIAFTVTPDRMVTGITTPTAGAVPADPGIMAAKERYALLQQFP